METREEKRQKRKYAVSLLVGLLLSFLLAFFLHQRGDEELGKTEENRQEELQQLADELFLLKSKDKEGRTCYRLFNSSPFYFSRLRFSLEEGGEAVQNADFIAPHRSSLPLYLKVEDDPSSTGGEKYPLILQQASFTDGHFDYEYRRGSDGQEEVIDFLSEKGDDQLRYAVPVLKLKKNEKGELVLLAYLENNTDYDLWNYYFSYYDQKTKEMKELYFPGRTERHSHSATIQQSARSLGMLTDLQPGYATMTLREGEKEVKLLYSFAYGDVVKRDR